MAKNKRPSLTDHATPSTRRLTTALAAELAANGLVVHDDDFYDQLRVYRMVPPEAINRRSMEALVRERALAYMDDLAEDTAERDAARRIARETAERVRDNMRGTTVYIRHLTDAVVDALPEVTDEDIAPVKAVLFPPKAPQPPRKRERAAYMAEYRATRKAAAEARTAEVLANWLDKHVDPGHYDARDLWTRWQTEILPRAAVKAPELADVGRTAWYALLEANEHTKARTVRNRRVVAVY